MAKRLLAWREGGKERGGQGVAIEAETRSVLLVLLVLLVFTILENLPDEALKILLYIRGVQKTKV